MKRFRIIIFAAVALTSHSQLRAEEADILETAQKNPLKIYTPAGLARYGDPSLAEAVDALTEIPRPWTVPKIIELFEKENRAWFRKLRQQVDNQSNQMWEGWEEEEKRCAHLITLLAASRDPRAAMVLANSIENPSLTVRVRAWEGLYYYFLTDPRYHQLPPEKPEGPRAYTNFLPEMRRQVLAWWVINRDGLKVFR